MNPTIAQALQSSIAAVAVTNAQRDQEIARLAEQIDPAEIEDLCARIVRLNGKSAGHAFDVETGRLFRKLCERAMEGE